MLYYKNKAVVDFLIVDAIFNQLYRISPMVIFNPNHKCVAFFFFTSFCYERLIHSVAVTHSN